MAATQASDPVLSARGRVAYAASKRDTELEYAARQQLSAARVERAIRKALDEAPPLTEEARATLAMLLMSGRGL